MESHKGSYYERVEIPWGIPVDVYAEDLGREGQIPGQKGLPASQWTETKLFMDDVLE